MNAGKKQYSETKFTVDDDMVQKLKAGYLSDPWCRKLKEAATRMTELMVKDGLWFLGNCLVVPAGNGLQETIFCSAHDTLGHFGFRKT